MTTPAEPKSYLFRVNGMSESGLGRMTVNFVQQVDGTTPGGLPAFANNVTLNLSTEDSRAYFPGDMYTVSFAVAVPKA